MLLDDRTRLAKKLSDDDKGIDDTQVSFDLPWLVQKDRKDHAYRVVVKKETRNCSWDITVAELNMR